MADNKSKITVRINDKDYTLIHEETEDYIQRVAMYLNNKIAAVSKGGLKLNESMEVVLASINITDELFKAQKNYVAVKNEVKRMMDEYEELKQTNSQLSSQVEQLLIKIDQLEKELVKKDVQLSNRYK